MYEFPAFICFLSDISIGEFGFLLYVFRDMRALTRSGVAAAAHEVKFGVSSAPVGISLAAGSRVGKSPGLPGVMCDMHGRRVREYSVQKIFTTCVFLYFAIYFAMTGIILRPLSLDFRATFIC